MCVLRSALPVAPAILPNESPVDSLWSFGDPAVFMVDSRVSITMLGRISARTGVRQKDEVPGDGRRSAISRFFGKSVRTRPEPPLAIPEVEGTDAQFDRFAPVRLSQVGVQKRRWQREQTAEDRAEERRSPVARYTRFDRALLGLELVGALVIAWLAFQYVYTVYFDTGVRRITGSGMNSVPPPAPIAHFNAAS